MSIDFTGVTDITIPEGMVKKITRKADGSMVWEKPSTDVKVYLISLYGYGTGCEKIIIEGTTYVDTDTETENCVVTVPIGTEVVVWVKNPKIHEESCGTIMIQNYSTNETVAATDSNNDEVQYAFTVEKDTVIYHLQTTGMNFVRIINDMEYFVENYGDVSNYI